jgi:hypothetical protein
VLSTLLILAAEAHEEESSKTAFYVLGGLCAVWAVLVSAMGIRNHDFPTSGTAARAVMGISAVLVVGAMASAVLTG